jgi:hypothetical protein
MKKILFIVGFLLLLVVSILLGWFLGQNKCIAPQSIVNLPLINFSSPNVRVVTPKINQTIISPLEIQGEARGTWYFEASFPVKLLDSNRNEVALGIASAQSDWMTENFVPFKLSLIFSKPATDTGSLVLIKDNPSGLPQNDAQVSFPIRFK